MDKTDIEQSARLEMLIGHLADVLQPARKLIAELQLRGNASAATRGELEHLTDQAGALCDQLRKIRKEVTTSR